MADEPKPETVTKSPEPPKPADAPKPAGADKPKAKAQKLPGNPRQPTGRELEKLKRDHFGDKPGAVRVDTDLASSEVKIVYVDAKGKETDGGVFHPDDKNKAE